MIVYVFHFVGEVDLSHYTGRLSAVRLGFHHSEVRGRIPSAGAGVAGGARPKYKKGCFWELGAWSEGSISQKRGFLGDRSGYDGV